MASTQTGFTGQRGVQVLDFAHQRFVDGQAACRVHQQHIEKVFARVVQPASPMSPVSAPASSETTRRRPGR